MPELAGLTADAFEAGLREHEERWLSPLAVRSYETRRRAPPEDECPLRTPLQRDRDRIVHTKAFPRVVPKADDPDTLEGKIVRLVDRVAYINHDIDDAIRAGVLDAADLPREEIELLGPTGSRRIDALVHDLVETSAREGDIRQTEEVGTAMLALRTFMFEHVYLAEAARAEHVRARATVRRIFEHLVERGDPVDDVIDYVAGMTDRFALTYAESLG